MTQLSDGVVRRLEWQIATCRDSYEAPSGKIMFRVWATDLAEVVKLARAAIAAYEAKGDVVLDEG